ncbi:hypothetical protein [Paenibacillus sp. 23TSA30-6]|uniref:hypothetical protein n=1 Tax=Paenibacillus sp. 23TSA30-6 TaxID=2546104 RepID=UPI001787ADD5|nr:hypothetical protein [Paenibacillus sp. 23TSA30-6]MBE0336183.1 hypothetical protein [Paenibacillus sp. 23TSA30-6]
MKKVKIIFLTSALLCILIVTGCNDSAQQDSSKPNVPSPTVQVDDTKKSSSLSYKQYRDLFSDMSQELQPAPFNFLENTKGNNIVAFDKEWSFGTRSMLTLDGQPTNEETQERIIYKKKDGTLLLCKEESYGVLPFFVEI